ncbi:acyl-CoA carboxylase subunit epsilon [Streptomyces sp. NBC_00536]|uniref:acyl-CoA carboxylase epsilon subunit n=1 Tax=Streptomyces sp. NBC_00536 TaxID=2975769 RepID=UPI002E80AC4E|nr:acyl-CoA carboxylase epsilon subunit [Streptomyces sp. NBC_00536]WUC79133.1 acyl-CoA carboxylase subunit epsilon [Streptomyces sp. NBC_00536]
MPVPALDGPLGPTLIEIIRGAPTAEEIAAVTALLTRLAAPAAPEPEAGPTAAGWDRAEPFPPVSWRARP